VIPADQDIERRRLVLRAKPYLQALYREWYHMVASVLPAGEGPVLEIGSGPGFINTVIRGVVRTDICRDSSLDAVVDGASLPFTAGSLRAIVGINVLHHLDRPLAFFAESARCLMPKSRLILIEPWNTALSGVFMRLFHDEKFDPQVGWPAEHPEGPCDNNALAWVVFSKCSHRFAREFPHLHLISTSLLMPIAYLLSGGVGRTVGAPVFVYPIARSLERAFSFLLPVSAMFALVVLERAEDRSEPLSGAA